MATIKFTYQLGDQITGAYGTPGTVAAIQNDENGNHYLVQYANESQQWWDEDMPIPQIDMQRGLRSKQAAHVTSTTRIGSWGN